MVIEERKLFIMYGIALFCLFSVLLAFHMLVSTTIEEPIDQDLWRCQQKYGPEAAYRLNKHGDAYCTDKRGREIKEKK